MESNVVENKEKELDIKQLIFYVIDNIKYLVIAGILFGILFGALGYIKAYKVDSENVLGSSVQDIIKKNKSKWNNTDTSVTTDAFNNPLPGTYIASARVYVDFDYSNIEGNYNLDFTAMNGKLQGDILALTCSNTSKQLVIDNLNLHSYGDMTNISLDDLRYMINCGFSGANIMYIQVADSDAERAIAMADELANNIVESASDYETVNSISLLEKACISYSSESHSFGMKDYVKSVIKYSIVGILLGVILVSCGCILRFILQEKVRTAYDLESIGVKAFGIIPKGEEDGKKEFTRLRYNISFLNMNSIVIIPVDDSISSNLLSEKILEGDDVSGKAVVTDNILDNPEVIIDARKSGYVILVSTYGKTSLKDIAFANDELEKAKVEVLGAVILDAMHV